MHSNIPSDMYLSFTKLVPRILTSGMPSSNHSDTRNDTPSLEPISSSSLEESETLNVLLSHRTIF